MNKYLKPIGIYVLIFVVILAGTGVYRPIRFFRSAMMRRRRNMSTATC